MFRLRGRLAKLIARGFHLYALPTLGRRSRFAADWLVAAVAAPDAIAFGLIDQHEALIHPRRAP